MTPTAAGWGNFAAVIEELADRISDPDDFRVLPGSAMAEDDRAAHPFPVSEAVRHIINATVDQLHGLKVAVHDAPQQHIAVGSTLARAAIENAASGLWIIGPNRQDHRIERVLRWHARNYRDFELFLNSAERDTSAELERNGAALQQIRSVAMARGINPDVAASGFKVTTPLTGCSDFTATPVYRDWQLASGFAHGRPWAYHGFLERETLQTYSSRTYKLRPREGLTSYLAMRSAGLLVELLRVREHRSRGIDPLQ